MVVKVADYVLSHVLVVVSKIISVALLIHQGLGLTQPEYKQQRSYYHTFELIIVVDGFMLMVSKKTPTLCDSFQNYTFSW